MPMRYSIAIATAFAMLFTGMAAQAALPSTQACTAAALDRPVCGDGKRLGWYFDSTTLDMHLINRGIDWLELDPGSGTLTISSYAGTLTINDTLIITGDQTVTGDIGMTGNLTVTGDVAVTGSITGTGSVVFKSYNLSDPGNAGTHYLAGFYIAPTAEAALTNAGATQTYGAANNGYGAHAFWVDKDVGTTDGSDLVLTVTGTSITDAGVRTPADSEIIVADATGDSSTDTYHETSKKWLGQVTYTLSSTGGTVFDLSGNYGFAKYEDFGNRAFTVTDFECVYKAGANESNFGLSLLKHTTTGWTYSAAAFAPGATPVADLDTTYSTDDEFDSGEYGAFKRAGLSTAVAGAGSEGVIIRASHAVNNSITTMDCHIGATF